MRAELARSTNGSASTTVYVTHDQVEAMTLGQRVAVMRDGVIQQVDGPQTLYHKPTNLFVAAFIGSPSMNLVEAGDRRGHRRVRRAPFPACTRTPARLRLGLAVILGIRPGTSRMRTSAGGPAAARGRGRGARGARQRGARDLPGRRGPRRGGGARAAEDDEDTTLIADDQRAMFNAQVDHERRRVPARGSARGRSGALPLLRSPTRATR